MPTLDAFPPELAQRLRLLTAHDTCVLLADDVGLAVLRFRLSLWTQGECYLAEIGARPGTADRGRGGPCWKQPSLEARRRGADHTDLGTMRDDGGCPPPGRSADSDAEGRRPDRCSCTSGSCEHCAIKSGPPCCCARTAS